MDKLGEVRELHAASVIRPFLATENPQLILLHISLPGLNGIQGVAVLRQKCPDLKLMMFSDIPTENEGIALLKLGVHGYANTYMSSELFGEAVNVVQSGEVWVGRKLMQRLISDLAAANQAPSTTRGFSQALRSLTVREREIALLICKASSNKRIASNLKITERTVKAHLSSIFRKTGTHDRLQLALLVNGQVAEHPAQESVTSNVV
ncbi:MAG: response regulator transcription factor [Gammaproteobacteria bacterium]